MDPKHLAYIQGMNQAVQSYGYPDWAAFEKDAALPLAAMGMLGRRGLVAGGLAGAGIGAVGGALTGDKNQSMLQRAGHGALKGGLVGGAVGGAAGAALPAIGQAVSGTGAGQQAIQSTLTKRPGLAQGAYRGLRGAMPAPQAQQQMGMMFGGQR